MRAPGTVDHVQLSKDIREDIKGVKARHSELAEVVRKDNYEKKVSGAIPRSVA